MITRCMFSVAALFIFALSACGEWVFSDNSAYLAVMIVDYTDSGFEGGHIHELPPCSGCDSLPLEMDFYPTWDFGSVDFRYTPTDEIVFSGGIIWMGGGQIDVPATIYPVDSFPQSSQNVAAPSTLRHFFHEPIDSTTEIDYAWQSIEQLAIVDELMGQQSFAGLYLYPPNVGMFDPEAAKIIVYIFRNAVPDTRTGKSSAERKPVMLMPAKSLWRNGSFGIANIMHIESGNGMLFDVQGRFQVGPGYRQ